MASEPGMDLPIIDLAPFLSEPFTSPAVQQQCHAAAEAIITYGALLLHDPRVDPAANATFLDLMEDYFAQPARLLRQDERPALGYQVGVTLENTEKPRCAADAACLRVIAALAEGERPLDIGAHQPDPKCRFFWRMGTAPPYATRFPALNAENVVPGAEAIRERWAPVMNAWGEAMKTAVADLSELLASGLGLDRMAFKSAAQYGPHLLAPTASDLRKYGEPDTILAGFHTDLNFLTIHGRSRFPGLHIWARNTGRRIPVRIPPGRDLLLVQAGKQLEHLTGGLVRAGYHEVVVNAATRGAMARRAREAPDRPLVRISSTFFWHLGSDFDLVPVPALVELARRRRVEGREGSLGEEEEEEEEEVRYPPMKVGEQVQSELKHIALMA